MRLNALADADRWERRFLILQKQVRRRLRPECDSKPVFILGKQRSGTTMLMRAFHRHPDMLVYDEHRDNAAFLDYRIRSAETVRTLLVEAHFPAVCMKPICDSHRISELRKEFPEAHIIWLYRDFKDVANSSLRKFDAATRAIRLVCTGGAGGGWFREGISPRIGEVLRETWRPGLSDFELACLVWWARNQLVLESGLHGRPGFTLLKYEALASAPPAMLRWLFQRLGMRYSEGVERGITARSIGRHPAPAIDQRVLELCRSTQARLDEAFLAQDPPVTGM
jgi:hypothetical protein